MYHVHIRFTGCERGDSYTMTAEQFEQLASAWRKYLAGDPTGSKGGVFPYAFGNQTRELMLNFENVALVSGNHAA